MRMGRRKRVVEACDYRCAPPSRPKSWTDVRIEVTSRRGSSGRREVAERRNQFKSSGDHSCSRTRVILVFKDMSFTRFNPSVCEPVLSRERPEGGFGEHGFHLKMEAAARAINRPMSGVGAL